MPRSAVAGSHLPAPIPPAKAPTPPRDLDLCPQLKRHLRRQIANPALPGAARSRREGGGGGGGGRRSGPATPLLRWKFVEKPPPSSGRKVEGAGGEAAAGPPAPPARVSARKLAAGIWHLRPVEADGNCTAVVSRRARLGLKSTHGHLGVRVLHNPLTADIHAHKNWKNELASPVSVLSPMNADIHQVKQLAGLPSSVMEKATKWDPESSMTPEEVYRFYSHLKLLDDQEVKAVSIVASLRTELEQAHSRINELETERQSTKTKLDHFLKRLVEEKESWRRREHEKIRSAIDGMKEDLNREKKRRQRTEVINSKMVEELAEARLSVKRISQDYEKERKAREVIEEVCDELAKEIEEDRAEIEALKMEALKIREEVEEEKRMLQMAEVWREERVQMKLIDARLTLEDKYSKLTKVTSELEAFLSALKVADTDAGLRYKAELLKEKAESLKVEEVKEFTYQPPPASEDIYAVFEELQPRQEANERDIEACSAYSPTSYTSKNMASPGTDAFLEPPQKQCEKESIESNEDADDDSDWETVSHAEEQGSSNSPGGSEVIAYFKESNASNGGAEWDKNVIGKLDNVLELSSTNTKQSRKMVSSICKLWRSSAHEDLEAARRSSTDTKSGRLPSGASAFDNDEDHKKVSIEISNGRLSSGIISNGSLSPEIGLAEGGSSPCGMEWSFPDSLNHPHMARGLKGCIEWPQNIHKQSLKAKLMEARMESQKVQIRHVLQQKI